MKTILVTGAAGFIGFHLSQSLLKRGDTVIGIDNLNDYYDVQLKKDRLEQLFIQKHFKFFQTDLADRESIADIFARHDLDGVVHLAAQAGVRYSLENPHTYINSNIVGFTNILEGCRHHHIGHLVYASSSSVYGANDKVPFAVCDRTDQPVSLYAATKRSNELMAYTYSHLFQIPTTGLRFFTVYGPWGRPDMAYFKFAKAILEQKPIPVFNHGQMRRDFTYIDDIGECIVRVMERVPDANTMGSTWNNSRFGGAPYKLYNIGNNQPVTLMDFIETLERHLGIEAQKEMLPMQPGDVPETYADIDDLANDTGFKPKTSLDEGLGRFVEWYLPYQARGLA